jgi:hypothetical protein
MTTTVRRQVALAGCVLDGESSRPLPDIRVRHRPLPDVRVQIVSAPAAFLTKLARQARQHGAGWEALGERPDRARTNTRGSFTFMDLPSGAYALAATLPSAGSRYGVATANAAVVRSQSDDVELQFVELLVPATTVVGTVVDAQDRPVALASVLMTDGSEHTFTDMQGRYALHAIEVGRRRVVVRARGFAAVEQVAELAEAGSTRTLSFTLSAQ